MSLPYIGKCFLCGAEDEALNEGICGKHSNEVAQAYLFGFADGKNSAEAPTVEPTAEGVREAAERFVKAVKDSRTDRCYVLADDEWESCQLSVFELLDHESAPFETNDITCGVYYKMAARVQRPAGSEDHLDDEVVVTEDAFSDLVAALTPTSSKEKA